jgi:putative zinc finger protein
VSMSHVDDGTLHAYLDGELSPAESQGIAAHIAQCPGCRGRLEEERALIARATELLALAAPPDRELPPFRAGDRKPPHRLWWRVRLPLAWAATIALALGIGRFLGPTGRAMRPSAGVAPTPVAADSAAASPAAPARLAQKPTAGRPALPAPRPASASIARADSVAPLAKAEGVARQRQAEEAGARLDRSAQEPARAAASAVAPQPHAPLRKALIDGRYQWRKESTIGIDSARLLLGTDPLVVAGLPVEAIYRGTMDGSALVIVEQVLDSSTTIQVMTGRVTPAELDEVATTNRGAVPAPTRAPAVDRAPATLFIDIRGPLSADSLAALRRRLQPLRP